MFLSCSPSFPSTVSKIQWRKYPQVRINPSTSTFALLKRISFCNDNAPRTSIWNRVSCWHQQWKIISPYQKGLASWPLSVPPLKAFSQIPPLKVSQLSHKLESAEKKKEKEEGGGYDSSENLSKQMYLALEDMESRVWSQGWLLHAAHNSTQTLHYRHWTWGAQMGVRRSTFEFLRVSVFQ